VPGSFGRIAIGAGRHDTRRNLQNPSVDFSDQMTQHGALAIVCGHGFAVICRMTMQLADRASRIVFGAS